jgi:hypothetical protein
MVVGGYFASDQSGKGIIKILYEKGGEIKKVVIFESVRHINTDKNFPCSILFGSSSVFIRAFNVCLILDPGSNPLSTRHMLSLRATYCWPLGSSIDLTSLLLFLDGDENHPDVV